LFDRQVWKATPYITWSKEKPSNTHAHAYFYPKSSEQCTIHSNSASHLSLRLLAKGLLHLPGLRPGPFDLLLRGPASDFGEKAGLLAGLQGLARRNPGGDKSGVGIVGSTSHPKEEIWDLPDQKVSKPLHEYTA
jgi:hypothetical protein